MITKQKSPFEEIKKFDQHGKPYWTSRDLCVALGYRTYQTFSVPLKKAIKFAEANRINVDDHFNREVKMVRIGSGAHRGVKIYHLTRDACMLIARNADAKKEEVQAALKYFSDNGVDFDGTECDVNCQKNISDTEKDKIRMRNRKHWEKLNAKVSAFYQEKMKLLDGVDGFKRDDSYHGNEAPHHMMYKLETLYSKDGHRGYEFLIEYDVFEPVVGIYYGCKGLILDGDEEGGMHIFDEEWKDICDEVAVVLENIFPGKCFTYRFKATNNANSFTYWPFWITLHEDEDIIEVGARAVRVIRSMYKNYIENEDVEALRKRTASPKKSSGKKNKIRFPVDVNFTEKTYNELLDKIVEMSKSGKGKDNQDLFKKFLEKATEGKYLSNEDCYGKKVWRIVQNTDVENQDLQNKTDKQIIYIVRLLWGYMQFYLDTLDLSKCEKGKAISPPYAHLSKVLLNMKGKSFGETMRKVCKKGDSVDIIINAWKILQTILELPKDSYKIVKDTLNLGEREWKNFVKEIVNG